MANDTCADAQLVTVWPVTDFDASGNAADLTNSPSCVFDSAKQYFAAWFKWTPSEDGFFQLDTFDGDAEDTCLSVWTGTCGSLVEVACGEDDGGGPGGFSSLVQIQVTGGTEYHIKVTDFYSSDPTPVYTLTLTELNFDPTPTWEDVLAVYPQINPDWAPLTDFTYGDFEDCVVIIHGGLYVFFAEVSGNVTGASEPNWASAPNPGDTISDGDITWYNGGLWADFPPEIQTWQPSHDYSASNSSVVLIYPTTPNGHLYVAYPDYFGDSDSEEPVFSDIHFGEYISDGDGYWFDLGIDAPSGDFCWTDDGEGPIVDVTLECSITITAPTPIPSKGTNQWRLHRFDAKFRGEQSS